jgi:hypothetical protein
MAEAIYKYEMNDHGTTELQLPVGARVLDFQYQRSGFGQGLVCWAIVDTDPTEFKTRKFRTVATGERYDFKDRKYRKTVQDSEGYVWHIFEILK